MESLPTWYTHLVSIVLGLIAGSFVNVMVARIPGGKSVVTPRSRCPRCQASIRWYDNIPVLSFLILRGRCRDCKAKISVRYPVIELVVAFLFLAAKARFGWDVTLFFRDWPFLMILVAITFIDLEHRIIPDVLSLGGLALGLLTSWAVPGFGVLNALLGSAVGFVFFYSLAWFYQWKTGRSGLGGGDIKLLAMLGAFLGVGGVFATILISSVIGSVVGILWAWMTRQKNLMTTAIPYGPFLVIGAVYYYLLGDILWFQFTIPT